jgi:hypothetical protein
MEIVRENMYLYVTRAVLCRAVYQACSRPLLAAAAQVLAQARSCGTCGGQSVTKQVHSEFFGFPIARFTDRSTLIIYHSSLTPH